LHTCTNADGQTDQIDLTALKVSHLRIMARAPREKQMAVLRMTVERDLTVTALSAWRAARFAGEAPPQLVPRAESPSPLRRLRPLMAGFDGIIRDIDAITLRSPTEQRALKALRSLVTKQAYRQLLNLLSDDTQCDNTHAPLFEGQSTESPVPLACALSVV